MSQTARPSASPRRRIVTGLDDAGRSCVLFDNGGGHASGASPVGVTLLWQSAGPVADNSGVADAATGGFSFDFGKGGTKCILVDVDPTDGLMEPGMHATDALDHVVVLDGELTLYLEHGEVDMRRGDDVVDRGVVHGWRNKGPERARMLVVTIPSLPVGAGVPDSPIEAPAVGPRALRCHAPADRAAPVWRSAAAATEQAIARR